MVARWVSVVRRLRMLFIILAVSTFSYAAIMKARLTRPIGILF